MKQQSAAPWGARPRTGWLLLVFLFIAGCGGVRTDRSPESRPPPGGGQKLVVWMLSDIQPEAPEERLLFEEAIADVNGHVAQVDLGVIDGDLLKSRSRDEDFAWFLRIRNRSKVRHWYEIAGNHDVRSMPLFRRYFPRPSFYGVEIGNILLLLLSDESTASKTDISDAAFS